MILCTFKKVFIKIKRNIAIPNTIIETKQNPTIFTIVFCLLNHIIGVLFILVLVLMVFSPFNVFPHSLQKLVSFSMIWPQLLHLTIDKSPIALKSIKSYEMKITDNI
jgi:hypothetical protein